MIDAHCHLDFDRFDSDRALLLSRAVKAGVKGFIVAGVDPQGWERQEGLIQEFSNVRVAYGLHPWAVARMDEEAVDIALAALRTRANFALGEMGLDRSRHCEPNRFPLQEKAFRSQLKLAHEKRLPIILHIVGAHGPALTILEELGVPEPGGMVHSYSGSAELIPRYESLGLHISFSASVTRPNAKKSHAAVRAVSRDRLLVETDCPDQPPPHRDQKRNLPEWLADVVRGVSSLRDEPTEDVAAYTAQNTAALFSLEDWL